MRQIILDTETTGLDPAQGHRLVEIAGVEMLNRRLSHVHFHHYLNPERDSDEKALEVHGLTREFLADKPLFADVVDAFLDYVSGAELVIHNAPFDVGFINHELAMLDRGRLQDYCPSIVDTLVLAKDLYPGKRNNLNALCERYGIDNSNRVLHGALLDAELLADVYLAMTRGQDSLLMALEETSAEDLARAAERKKRRMTLRPLRVQAPSEAEWQAHQQYLEAMAKANKSPTLWQQLLAASESTT